MSSILQATKQPWKNKEEPQFPFESEKICQKSLVHCRIKYDHEYGNYTVV